MKKNKPLPEVKMASPDLDTSEFDLEAVDVETKKLAPKKNRRVPPAIWLMILLIFSIAFGIWFYQPLAGAMVDFKTDPPGATVILDGTNIGITPLKKHVSMGRHHVQLILDGFIKAQEEIDVNIIGKVFRKSLSKAP